MNIFKDLCMYYIIKYMDNKTDLIIDQDDSTGDQSLKNTGKEDPFLLKCEELINKITKNYRSERDEIRELMKLYKKELKNKKNKKKNKETGFTKPEIVPEELANFIGIEKGTEMPRTELTKRVYKEIKRRGLFYKNDKRVLRADKEIQKMFKLKDNVNKINDPKDKEGFNFFNLQTYIAKCYNEQY
jgi:chromatin remodeling complex protein RSC6